MNLADYFAGVTAKRLTAHEVDPEVSNGHEFQGVKSIAAFLGTDERKKLPTTYLWLTDDEQPVRLDLTATWYDSRERNPKRRAEWRLVYPTSAEDVVWRAKAGDLMLIGVLQTGGLMAMLCPGGSAIEQQLLWLFGLNLDAQGASQRELTRENGQEIGFAARYVLDLIEVDVPVVEDDWLDKLVRKFGNGFPSTAEFSKFAREAVGPVDALGAPDNTLMAWLDFEERLFRTFEYHLVSERLEKGFVSEGGIDVDGFVQFSLSVQNRRKARAGYALENHLEIIFREHALLFERGATTEGKKKPDFLFPGAGNYHDPNFSREALTLLGAKSTCKDRWRQVLSEGRFAPSKYLLTLEPGISLAQTEEMAGDGLQLVVPADLQVTYLQEQRDWLMDLSGFLVVVAERQAKWK